MNETDTWIFSVTFYCQAKGGNDWQNTLRVHSKSIQFSAPCHLCSVLNFKPWLELTLLLLSRLLHHNNLHSKSLVVMLIADSLQISCALVECMLADVTELNWPECLFYSRDYLVHLFKPAGRSMTGSYNALCPFLPASLCVCVSDCVEVLCLIQGISFHVWGAFLFLPLLVICGVSCPWRQFWVIKFRLVCSYYLPSSLPFQCNQSLELKPNPIEPIRPLVPGPFPVIHPR